MNKIAEAIREIRAEDPGWYRIEQYGDGGQNIANVNRIWDIGQNISTIYSSAYNTEYKKFRDETYGINEAFRNRMMQTVSDDPLFWQLMGVKYILADTQPEGYELYRNYGDISGLPRRLCRADCLRGRSGGFRVGIQVAWLIRRIRNSWRQPR